MYSTTAIVKKTLRVVAKNGYYIHAIHIILIMCRCNICLASFIVMKLYSVNYFIGMEHNSLFSQIRDITGQTSLSGLRIRGMLRRL